MNPTLQSGERIWVNKLKMGPRIYKSLNINNPEMDFFRLPGFSKLKVGDVAVFNTPEGRNDGKIAFKINYIYAKRCLAIPGDTLTIKNGIYFNGSLPLKFSVHAEDVAVRPDSILCEMHVVIEAGQFASDKLNWTIRNMGPIVMPRKGETIEMSPHQAAVYSRIIKYEYNLDPSDVIGKQYTFKNDYYFFAGDNILDSKDSRYFGLVPGGFIVGIVSNKKAADSSRPVKCLRQASRLFQLSGVLPE